MAETPIRLPTTQLPMVALYTATPQSVLPEMRLPWPAAGPPMRLLSDLTEMPYPLGRATVPAALVPMKLPSTTLPPATSISTPSSEQRLMAKPRSVELPAARVKQLGSAPPTAAPFTSTTGVPA